MTGARGRSTRGAAPPRRRPAAPAPPPPDPPPPVAVPDVGPSVWSLIRWGAVFVAVLVALIYVARPILSVFAASAATAYLLDPLVRRVQRGRSRDAAIVVLGVLGGLGVLVLLALVVPGLVAQVASIAGRARGWAETISANLGPWLAELERLTGVHAPLDAREAAALLPQLAERIGPDVQEALTRGLSGLAGGSLQLLGAAVSLSLVPLLTFYLLSEWPRITEGAFGLLPERWRPTVGRIVGAIDLRIGAFVRGQLLVAAIMGGIYTLGLLVAGVDLALTLGLLSGGLFLLPFVGPTVAAILAVGLTLLEYGIDWHVALVLGTYLGAQAVEGMFLTPYLVGDSVGLHPLVVILAIVIFGDWLGIWGLVIALPATAALAVLAAELVALWRASRTYNA